METKTDLELANHNILLEQDHFWSRLDPSETLEFLWDSKVSSDRRSCLWITSSGDLHSTRQRPDVKLTAFRFGVQIIGIIFRRYQRHRIEFGTSFQSSNSKQIWPEHRIRLPVRHSGFLSVGDKLMIRRTASGWIIQGDRRKYNMKLTFKRIVE